MTTHRLERARAELLPCPFCGERADYDEVMAGESRGGWFIVCSNRECMASTNLVFPLKEDVRGVLAEKWNRRTLVPDLSRRVREMEALVEAAYREGFKTGETQTATQRIAFGFDDVSWNSSAARRALSGAREKNGGEHVGR